MRRAADDTTGRRRPPRPRDHVDNGLTVTEVMAKYDVASVAPLRRWCREWIGYNVLDSLMRDD